MTTLKPMYFKQQCITFTTVKPCGIIILSLTVELIRRVSISSDVLSISCLCSGIALLNSVL